MPPSRNGKTFETLEQVTELNERRIARLRLSGSTRARQQAEAIAACAPPNTPCGLASCAVCCRQHRRAFTAEGLGLLQDADNVVRVTAFFSESELRPRTLKTIDPKLAVQRFRMGVRRADLNDRNWFGGLEFDWDVETSRWEFHVHTVTAASDHREFDDLKRLFPRTKQAPRPWFCERLSDLPGGISYCLKHHPCRKETYQSTTATLVDGRLKSFTKKYSCMRANRSKR